MSKNKIARGPGFTQNLQSPLFHGYSLKHEAASFMRIALELKQAKITTRDLWIENKMLTKAEPSVSKSDV